MLAGPPSPSQGLGVEMTSRPASNFVLTRELLSPEPCRARGSGSSWFPSPLTHSSGTTFSAGVLLGTAFPWRPPKGPPGLSLFLGHQRGPCPSDEAASPACTLGQARGPVSGPGPLTALH